MCVKERLDSDAQFRLSDGFAFAFPSTLTFSMLIGFDNFKQLMVFGIDILIIGFGHIIRPINLSNIS